VKAHGQRRRADHVEVAAEWKMTFTLICIG